MCKRILIVDDLNDAREVLRHWLEHLGFQIIEASDGAEALECVKWGAPDLILMDMALPRIDGITATKQIREMDAGKKVPVIGMTGYAEWFREKALHAGCNKVISKPVDFEFLKQLIFYYVSI